MMEQQVRDAAGAQELDVQERQCPECQRVLAFALVNLLTLALVIVGGWLGAAGWPNVFALFGALLCFLIAWLLRPRFSQLCVKVASRDKFPVLYKVADEMVKYLGEPGVQDIVVGEGFYVRITY